MVVLLGQVFPDFHAQTNEGEISMHQYIGDS